MTTISIFRFNLQAILLTGMQVGSQTVILNLDRNPKGTGQESRINQEHRQARGRGGRGRNPRGGRGCIRVINEVSAIQSMRQRARTFKTLKGQMSVRLQVKEVYGILQEKAETLLANALNETVKLTLGIVELLVERQIVLIVLHVAKEEEAASEV